MSAVRTLTALGAAFGQSIPELARSQPIFDVPSLTGSAR